MFCCDKHAFVMTKVSLSQQNCLLQQSCDKFETLATHASLVSVTDADHWTLNGGTHSCALLSHTDFFFFYTEYETE